MALQNSFKSVLFLLVMISASVGCASHKKNQVDELVNEVEENSVVTEVAMDTVVQAPQEGIKFFEGTWEEALLTARTEKKLIFLDAYAVWCGPCKKMESGVFPKPDVGEFFNANFINFKMDMEKGIGVELANKWRLTSYPTLYFVNSEADTIQSTIGYHKANDLIELGRMALEK